MSYHGDVLNQCGSISIDCSQVDIVVVSGDGPNICGHLLIHTGSTASGYYFHVAETHSYPSYMNEAGYRWYLRDSGKTEIRWRGLSLPNSGGALLYLEGLMANKWPWLVIPNNCVAFVEEVIHAGGGDWSSYSNCPDLATQDTMQERINRFINQVETEIYNLFGVSRL